MTRPPLPVGFGLRLDGTVRRYRGGAVLAGGRPRRVVRLTPAGARAVDALLAGADVGAAARALGRRLVDAGIAHPVPPAPGPGPASPSRGAPPASDVTVVVPVRDRPAELARCLASLGGDAPVLVVDDGSRDPAAIAAVVRAGGARLVRRARSGGPAVARNDGLARVRTPVVAFVDSDCEAPPRWIDPLLAHLADPEVAAVAPRVRGVAGPGAAGRWAAARSPLDLGPRPGAVAPGRPCAYVPTAALVVRMAALVGIAGPSGAPFDPALRHGEDVDLVWRLHDAGHVVRYEPTVVVGHHEPSRWRPFLRRRFDYGASAGPLARRHGARLAPAVLPPGALLPTVALVAGRPRLAAAGLVVRTALVGRRLARAGAPPHVAPAWAAHGAWQAADGACRATTMLAPLPLVGALALRAAAVALRRGPDPARTGPRRGSASAGPRLRRGAGSDPAGGRPRWPVRAARIVGVLAVTRWARARADGATGGLDPIRWTLAGLVDDAAYGAGVWVGAVRARAPRALLPTLGRAPGGRS
ncbi:MAG: mycofactocin biosynthesis glycosyltransferase MftF [Solirubrobacteraceae bacterium]|nr:mycofactocin biosynthesis glycosyltransferase MftF [Solirubrobacteraceae bacterium]